MARSGVANGFPVLRSEPVIKKPSLLATEEGSYLVWTWNHSKSGYRQLCGDAACVAYEGVVDGDLEKCRSYVATDCCRQGRRIAVSSRCCCRQLSEVVVCACFLRRRQFLEALTGVEVGVRKPLHGAAPPKCCACRQSAEATETYMEAIAIITKEILLQHLRKRRD